MWFYNQLKTLEIGAGQDGRARFQNLSEGHSQSAIFTQPVLSFCSYCMDHRDIWRRLLISLSRCAVTCGEISVQHFVLRQNPPMLIHLNIPAFASPFCMLTLAFYPEQIKGCIQAKSGRENAGLSIHFNTARPFWLHGQSNKRSRCMRKSSPMWQKKKKFDVTHCGSQSLIHHHFLVQRRNKQHRLIRIHYICKIPKEPSSFVQLLWNQTQWDILVFDEWWIICGPKAPDRLLWGTDAPHTQCREYTSL